MKAQTAKRILRIQEWATQITDCKQSDKTVRQWCNEHGIKTKTFYYRMRVVREELLEMAETMNVGRVNDIMRSGVARMIPERNRREATSENHTVQYEGPVFAALPIPRTAAVAITVRIGGCTIDVQNGAEATMVEQVLRLAARL